MLQLSLYHDRSKVAIFRKRVAYFQNVLANEIVSAVNSITWNNENWYGVSKSWFTQIPGQHVLCEWYAIDHKQINLCTAASSGGKGTLIV